MRSPEWASIQSDRCLYKKRLGQRHTGGPPHEDTGRNQPVHTLTSVLQPLDHKKSTCVVDAAPSVLRVTLARLTSIGAAGKSH